MQQGQRHSSSKSRSELFNPSREEPVSGFLGFSHKQSGDVKETENNFSGHLYKRSSHSGPLVRGACLSKGPRKDDDLQPLGSNRVNPSKLSGLVASRTSLSENQEGKTVPAQPGTTSEVRKSVESSNGSESRRRQNKKGQSQRVVDVCHAGNGRAPTKESSVVSLLYSLFRPQFLFPFGLRNSQYACAKHQ